MLKRTVFLMLCITLLLCAAGALADPVGTPAPSESAPAGPVSVEFETVYAPTAEPTHDPFATPTPIPSATPVPTPTPVVELSLGSRGSAVSDLQRALGRLGFSAESADGIFGSRTEAALMQLQDYLVMQTADGKADYSIITSGVADKALLELIADGGIPVYSSSVALGDTGAQVMRVQTRLAALGYMAHTAVDGKFGEYTVNALTLFQTENGMPANGEAGRAIQELLFSNAARPCSDPNARYPYRLIVDLSEQRVYVYQYENGSYSKLKSRFVCSTGLDETPTPVGTYTSTEQLNEWHYFREYEIWARYSYRIVGAYYFHSVLFQNEGDERPTHGSVSNLGHKASHGCVRLSVENAQWIYFNCPAGTTVIVRE